MPFPGVCMRPMSRDLSYVARCARVSSVVYERRIERSPTRRAKTRGGDRDASARLTVNARSRCTRAGRARDVRAGVQRGGRGDQLGKRHGFVQGGARGAAQGGRYLRSSRIFARADGDERIAVRGGVDDGVSRRGLARSGRRLHHSLGTPRGRRAADAHRFRVVRAQARAGRWASLEDESNNRRRRGRDSTGASVFRRGTRSSRADDERRTDDDDTFSGDTPCNMETIDIDRRCVPRNQCMSSARIGRLLRALCGEHLRVLLISLKMSDNWVWYHSDYQ